MGFRSKYRFFYLIIGYSLFLTIGCDAQVQPIIKLMQPLRISNNGLDRQLTINERIRLATYIGIVDVRSGYADKNRTCYKISSQTVFRGSVALKRACSKMPMAVGRTYLIIAHTEQRYLKVSYEMLVVSQEQFPAIAPLKSAVIVGPPSSSQPYILLRNLPTSYNIGITKKYSADPVHYDATIHLFSYYSLNEMKLFIKDISQACHNPDGASGSDRCLQAMHKWSFFHKAHPLPSKGER